ncbi:hypothetical protein ZIOFF_034650 [Zingiber officinale]|uniref:SPARK domain-containing protein n=1 Tax=Zingiber officinale TaxID=94328 RepID=A0A8J5LDS0_ZINOF|nr:hypothetical protein ZIOFF_034650 [Zingiber officinale]
MGGAPPLSVPPNLLAASLFLLCEYAGLLDLLLQFQRSDFAVWFVEFVLKVIERSLLNFCNLDKILVNSFELANPVMEAKETNLLPDTSPNSAPQPFIPLLAPSPMATPFFHNSTPKLSGQCSLNFSAVDNLLRTTAVDCWASFAPFLANVICCPQFEATLVILIGQASKDSGLLALDSVHANYCLSDIQQILGSQGVPSDLHDICSIHSSNLSEGSCPINDTIGFESVVDSSKLLAACSKVDAVNECCRQICQSAINEAAKNLVLKDGGLMTNMEINDTTVEYSSTVNSCKNIVLRWLSSRLDSSSAKQVLRGLSNCNVNGACPLNFPDTKDVARDCSDGIKNNSACCHAMDNYVSHLQKQSFITNLQALGCAASLESGCLLPSLPSDATFDPYSGISFTCDLNDNIAAPWPSASQPSSSTSVKYPNYPALPAATSSSLEHRRNLVAISGGDEKLDQRWLGRHRRDQGWDITVETPHWTPMERAVIGQIDVAPIKNSRWCSRWLTVGVHAERREGSGGGLPPAQKRQEQRDWGKE